MDTTERKIAIVCDNYKLNKFKTLLFKYNIEFTHKPLTPKTVSIFCLNTTKEEIAKIVDEVKKHFSSSN